MHTTGLSEGEALMYVAALAILVWAVMATYVAVLGAVRSIEVDQLRHEERLHITNERNAWKTEAMLLHEQIADARATEVKLRAELALSKEVA